MFQSIGSELQLLFFKFILCKLSYSILNAFIQLYLLLVGFDIFRLLYVVQQKKV